MPADPEILDPNWIAAVLSISVTVFVFLLGLPMVFIQTFIPEELRKYYPELLKAERKRINFSALLLLVIVLIFGNHASKYLIQTFGPNQVFTINKNGQIAFFYVLSLLVFVWLCWRVFTIFKKGIFRTENFKNQIINLVFDEVERSFEKSSSDKKTLHNEDFSKLIDLASLLNHHIDKSYFHDRLLTLLLKIIADEHYKGEGAKAFFEKILFNDFVKNEDFSNYGAVERILSICALIASKCKKSSDFQSFDSEYISEIFLFYLCIKFLKTDNINLAREGVRILVDFNAPQSVHFKIHFIAFEHKIYSMVVEAVKKITQGLQADSFENQDRTPVLNNLIAYLAMFYSGNKEMKRYAHKCIERLGSCIDTKACFVAKEDFFRNSKFDTAGLIGFAIENNFRSR